MEKNGLSVGDLLKKTYEALKERLQGQEMKLPLPARTEIANDSDWHRTRVGHMEYESVCLIEVAGKKWLIGLGKACGAYPADPFNSDILALPFEGGEFNEGALAEICCQITQSSYFRHSLVVGVSDGGLGGNTKGSFGLKALDLLREVFSCFIAQELEIDPTVFHLDLRPVVTKPRRYKPELVDRLVDSLVKVLESS